MSDVWIDLPKEESVVGSVSIVDATTGNELTVNPNGSIDVEIVSTTSMSVKSLYQSVTSVSSGVPTTIINYTVPVGETSYLGSIQVSGDNIAQYDILVNSVQFARQRTYYGGGLNTVFNFSTPNLAGYTLNAGDNVMVIVTQNQTSLGSFEARMTYAQ